MSGEVILAAHGLTWEYEGGERDVLTGVDLEIHAGEFLGIVGPNEAGKSTLAAALKGIIPRRYNGIFHGSVELFGKDIQEYDAAEVAALVGLVFSDPDAQFTAMTVEEEITFGLENIGLSIEEIGERLNWVVDLVGLHSLLPKSPYELSGGQKQRVAIAGVLAMQPRVMILDEPTSMLDPVSKAGVFRLLQQLKEQLDMTVVVIEHNLDRLVEVCDRLVMVADGRVAADATLGTFFQGLTAEQAGFVRVPGTVVFFQEVLGRAGQEQPVRLADMAAVCSEILRSAK